MGNICLHCSYCNSLDYGGILMQSPPTLTEILNKEFEYLSQISGKAYGDIAKFYYQAKKQIEAPNVSYTEFEYQDIETITREIALSLLRDYALVDDHKPIYIKADNPIWNTNHN